MEGKSVPSYVVTVHIAGDAAEARRLLRQECWEEGLCVTISPETFVYTGGEEDGVRVGFVNYPRFPNSELAIKARACHVAQFLMLGLCQRTALVVASDETIWYKTDPPGARDEETPAKSPTAS